jgi:release factor glutamine methyltransferase
MIGTDINPRACEASLRTAKANEVELNPVQGHLLSALKPVWGKIDMLVFNPPYVPTDDLE